MIHQGLISALAPITECKANLQISTGALKLISLADFFGFPIKANFL